MLEMNYPPVAKCCVSDACFTPVIPGPERSEGARNP